MIQSTMPSVISELRSKKQELEGELLEFDDDFHSSKHRREFAVSIEALVKSSFATFVTGAAVDKSNSDGWTYRALVEKAKREFANKVFCSDCFQCVALCRQVHRR